MSDMWYKSVDGVITDVCIWGKEFIPGIKIGESIINHTNEKHISGALYTHAQCDLDSQDRRIIYRNIDAEEFVKRSVPTDGKVFLDKDTANGYKVIYLKEFMQRLKVSRETAAKMLCISFEYFKLLLSGARTIGKRVLQRASKIIHLSFPQYIQLLEHEGFFEAVDKFKHNTVLNNAIHSLEIIRTIVLRKGSLNGTT